MRALELGLALVWLLMGLAIASESLRLGLFGMFGPDRGFFPFLAGVVMTVAAAALLVSGGSRVAPGTVFWASGGAAWRVAVIVVLMAAMIALLPRLGFLLSGALITPIMIRLVGPATWLFAIAIGVTASLAIHVLFVRLLQQSLPAGPLQGWI